MNLKKLFSLLLVLAFAVVVAACNRDKKLTVTFNSNGGTAVGAVTVNKGKPILEPEDPSKANNTFTGWYTDKELEKAFDFATEIEDDLTLYAGWSTGVVVRFNTRTNSSVETVELASSGGTVNKPADPTREGYRFGGWFFGRAGLTWLEPEAVSFPLEVTEGTTLRAYWEPLNSKAVNYTKAETYTTSITEGTTLVLNPLVYQWSHENDFIDMMVTALYATEVDWAKAIDDGIADYVGDFSKIQSGEFAARAFDYHNIKVGATRFPVDADGNEHLTEDGRYDREGASQINSRTWTYHIRKDLKFEDGTPITAHTYEYTLKQYLDPQQNNYRSTSFYQDDVEKNGYPILNAAEYRKQLVNETTVDWSQVGFEVLDDYSFKVTFWKDTSQSSAVGLANTLRLVHPDKYEASLTNGINSTYGTPVSPYVSYGSYILKSWDENQMLVFNKNYDYVARDTISYKSQVIQVVDTIQTQTQLYKDGTLSVLGLTNDNYSEFSEDANLKRSWNGYPQYIAINLAGSRLEKDGHEQPEIMFDKRFRQALLYGFDRNYYAASVYTPNVPSLLPIPADATAYLQDDLLFNQSPQHLAVLAKHEINPSLNGYIPERAVELFNQAYDDWVADGNEGPVVLKYVAANENELGISLATYVKNNYEELFNGEGFDPENPQKFKLEIEWGSQTSTTDAQKNWEFDLALINVGFGQSYGAQWQYPFIAYLGADQGGANLGLSQPYDVSTEDGVAAYMTEIIEVDFTNTYNYLKEMEDTLLAEDAANKAREAHEAADPKNIPADAPKDKDGNPVPYEYSKSPLLVLLEELYATDDKEAGLYKGEMGWLAKYNLDDTPWDGVASEPFNGAVQDIWNMLAAFEDIFLEHVTMIPTVTRASATVYKDYVNILWPEYTVSFGWGTNRYRYLSSDPTMQDGFYNSYKVAFEAQE